jgi:CheY-like chemotaxis protein
MDMHMPLMDGIEAAQRIQELNAGVPIVAMTANIMSNDLERYATLGIHDYIGKPFTSQELWRCLMNYFTPVTLIKEDTDELIESDKKLRQRIIEIFVDDNETKFDEITEAIKSGDIRLAHRLVHSLKSNAGQLNMPRLQQIAREVENLLSDGTNLVTPRHMANLKYELNAALETCKPLARAPIQAMPAAEPISKAAARKLLEELHPLLDSGNPESLNYIDRLHLLPGSKELIRQIEDMDFEQAKSTMNELKYKILGQE